MANAKKSTVIIKKIIKGGHGGHHGGAWKVAYADFVTAMMCFFLVMWLMGSDDITKAAIEAYFRNPNPTSPWRPDLKDNENIPLGNQTGAGESVLKGAGGKVDEKLVKDPVARDTAQGKVDEENTAGKDPFLIADSMTFHVKKEDLFPNKNAKDISEPKAQKVLGLVEKLGRVFPGTLKIESSYDPSLRNSYELEITRLVAVQQFISDRNWFDEESIKLVAEPMSDSAHSKEIEPSFILTFSK